MSQWMEKYSVETLDRTILSLCKQMKIRLGGAPRMQFAEYQLRRELVGCILGSQVTYQAAVKSTENLEAAGLLSDERWQTKSDKLFERDVFAVLSGSLKNLKHDRRHRFPKVRAMQVAAAREELVRLPLSNRVNELGCVKSVRRSLISALPGIGPKQSSMFLRNIGRSYDLAILDTHVLRFMEARRQIVRIQISSLCSYESTESLLIEYADSVGFQVGYLDWAIWATMKAARELAV